MPDFPHYIVSNHGRVLNQRTHRYLKGYLSKHGTRVVNLYGDGKSVDRSIPVLVASLFHPDYVDRIHIVALDGDRENAHIDNIGLIDWTTKEPRETTVKHYKWAKKVRVVEWDQVFPTVRTLADHLGGQPEAIYRCLRGEQKTHLGLTFEVATDEPIFEKE